ncbi:MAG TPA: nuclear transport factor 2 family protein [Bryobacteraceae bacterium]|nr:nuclear transport factor 2 family protein [Bryobacteraceae bacterium]
MSGNDANFDCIQEFLTALQTRETGESIRRFFHPEALQIELPNRLNPNGGQSDLAALRKRSELAAQMMRSQTWEIRSVVSNGERVAVEALWAGTLAVQLGTLEPGAVMKAHFAMFFEFRDGLIFRQRNYDCFEPW